MNADNRELVGQNEGQRNRIEEKVGKRLISLIRMSSKGSICFLGIVLQHAVASQFLS